MRGSPADIQLYCSLSYLSGFPSSPYMYMHLYLLTVPSGK